ncbi:hypothetical protein FHS27_004912 [Rhodopirellula rubra]|uniref:Uncharacterized protein n=1 Tax=Aporhodopirellula rubra TaxID=980271 RepID=A0A7W5H8J9_9BACT|nr:hypothetical protein [Aporhodopirellula rubra]MBB3209076.1 hypothetical protein [Aporhodopirellula rubra]
MSVQLLPNGTQFDVRITGDNADNAVQVRQLSNEIIQITGLKRDGSITTINGKEKPFIIPQRMLINSSIRTLDSIDTRTGDGGDEVKVRDVVLDNFVFSDLSIDTEGGNRDDSEVVSINNVFVQDDIWITADPTAQSNVRATIISTKVGDDIGIALGAGNDAVTVINSSADDISVRTRGGNDTVNFSTTKVADLLFADLGNGNDSLRTIRSEAGRASFNGGDGFDTLDLRFGGTTNNNFDPIASSREFRKVSRLTYATTRISMSDLKKESRVSSTGMSPVRRGRKIGIGWALGSGEHELPKSYRPSNEGVLRRHFPTYALSVRGGNLDRIERVPRRGPES